ncbi:DUF3298 domain-containing protein [Mucilaginibacter conchicola]|uniref:DUF3298 domain-containing protein n=1 Tax=Mucilaginibacter conchicola TaxID=2303333 RepID=A0A372NXQ1_9SPHI|nr:DUF3298 and DUF4163 domain-containing protein [Mucilaginibacter conchicola]RFZ94297.1 DUF3298 domain-containing protein [Mucilaginibacter conchicola]
MKNITTSTLLVAILGLSACQFGTDKPKEQHEIFKDTLVYNYQNIHERAPDCGEKADSACTVVSIKYPVFAKMPMLNDTIVKKLAQLGIMDDRKPDTSLTLVAKKFIQSYVDFKKTEKRSQMFFTMDSYAKVLAQDSSLVTLEYGGYNYQGGAHGGSFTGFINWNRKTGKEVTLKEIIADGKYPELSKIAEGIFRKSEKLSDTSSLARDYFFKDNKFALNENYSLTPTGLRFVYNQYEIKPYAAGQTELLVPYSSIKNILRPNTAISQYVK